MALGRNKLEYEVLEGATRGRTHNRGRRHALVLPNATDRSNCSDHRSRERIFWLLAARRTFRPESRSSRCFNHEPTTSPRSPNSKLASRTTDLTVPSPSSLTSGLCFLSAQGLRLLDIEFGVFL